MSFIEEKVSQYTESSDEAFEKRKFFFMYRETLLSYYLVFIEKLNELQERKLIYYMIKGSSAWFMNLMAGQRSVINSQKLFDKTVKMFGDEMDAFAFLPQNWDITVFVDQNNLDDAFREISKIFRKIEKMMTEIPKTFKFENKSLNKIEAFRGYYLALCTGAKKATRFSESDMEKYEKFSDYVCQSINGFFFVWMNLIPLTNLQDTTEKLFRHISTNYQADMLSNSKIKATFLNVDGLLLFNSILNSSDVNRASEKGFDIDKIRSKWIKDSIENSGGNIVSNYFNLIKWWTDAFGSNTENPIFVDKFQYQNILYTIQTELLSNLVVNDHDRNDIIDVTLINLFRPIVNTLVIDLNNVFSKYKHNVIEKIEVVIVGGDAFTRYIKQSSTSDIDIKVIVTPKIDVKDVWMPDDVWNDIQGIMTHVMSKYIVYLSYIYMGSRVSFRLRDIDVIKDKLRNFYLYSIDVRTIHNIQVENLGNLEEYRHELALFDAAIIFDRHRYYSNMNVINNLPTLVSPNLQEYYINLPVKKYKKNPLLPIATTEFLMADIEQTYSSKLAKIRIAKGKSNKDIVRYNALKDFITTINDNNKIDLFIVSTLLNIGGERDVSTIKFINLVKIYSAIHSENIKEKKLLGKNKFQMPFHMTESQYCFVNPEIRTICRSFTEQIPELKIFDCMSAEFKNVMLGLDSKIKYKCMNMSPQLFNL